MTVEEACAILRATARPGVHGSLTVNLKDGGVASVDLRQAVNGSGEPIKYLVVEKTLTMRPSELTVR